MKKHQLVGIRRARVQGGALGNALWIALGIALCVALSSCTQPRLEERVRASNLALRDAGPERTVLVENMLLPSDVPQTARFGSAVALSGDLLVAATPSWSLDGSQSTGGAYVFTRSPTTREWLQQTRVVPHDSTTEWAFSVAADGDTIALGVPYFDPPNKLQSGAVYIFDRHQGGRDQWGEVIKLSGHSLGDLAYFGSSVALQGDLLVVGAPQPTALGSVQIFERNRGGANAWGKVEALSYYTGGFRPEYFGVSVALDGDMLLVSATSADVSYYESNDGAAYLYQRDAVNRDQWNFVTRFTQPEALACTGGKTIVEMWAEPIEVQLAWAECGDGDTATDNLHWGGNVTVQGDTAVVTGVGAAYVFERDPSDANRWPQVGKLESDDGVGFGRVVLDGETLLIGATYTDVDSKVDQGAVYVYRRDPATRAFGLAETMVASNGVSNDHFGNALALEGTTLAIGASDRNSSRGAVYVHDTAPVRPLPCQPATPPTDTLVESGSITRASGLTLRAPAGSLSAPVRVWLSEVPAPADPMITGTTPLGPYYDVGAECTTLTPAQHAFQVELPVPVGTNTATLAAARLEPLAGASGGAASGWVWLVAFGAYDAATGRYMVEMPMLGSEGNRLVLIDVPSLAASAARRPRPSDTPGPHFIVQCIDCPSIFLTDSVAEVLTTAYAQYHEQGLCDPRLPRIAADSEDEADAGAQQTCMSTQDFAGINVYSRGTFPCSILPSGLSPSGAYKPDSASLNICLAEAEPVDPTVIRHELFHAVQHAYDNYHAQWPSGDLWFGEGTAEAAAASTGNSTRRNTARALRPTHVSLPLQGAGAMDESPEVALYPYQAQDFWVHVFNSELNGGARQYSLGAFADFLAQGAQTSDVAAAMLAAPDRYAPLGKEYWAWVKNQSMEKTVPLDHARRACRLERALIDYPHRIRLAYAPQSDHVSVDFQAPLEAKLVAIRFRDALEAEVTVKLESEDDDIGYKVYLEGDTQPCAAISDNQRVFTRLDAGSTVYVLLANKAYETNKTPRSYTVKVDADNPDGRSSARR